MFRWFQSKATCPVNDDMRAWIDMRWNWLESQFGRDRLRNVEVVLPNAEFFPDPFEANDESAQRMLDRVCAYMDVDRANVRLQIYADRNEGYIGNWRQGTSGLYVKRGNEFQIWIEEKNLFDPLSMVATMAHELSHVHLLGGKRVRTNENDHEPLTDLLTVFLGLGVFTANAVIREEYWHAGRTSGWSMGRQGYLGMPEYGYSFSRFALARDEDGSGWVNELRLDVRTAFKQAMRFHAEEDAGRG